MKKKCRKVLLVQKKALPLHSQFRNDLLTTNNNGIWCNGNTTDSGPVIPGSSPGIPTKSIFLFRKMLFCFICPSYGSGTIIILSLYSCGCMLKKGLSGKVRVSGFFRLVTPYVRNKVVPLPYGTDQATTRHSSGCAYRQLRCCKF